MISIPWLKRLWKMGRHVKCEIVIFLFVSKLWVRITWSYAHAIYHESWRFLNLKVEISGHWDRSHDLMWNWWLSLFYFFVFVVELPLFLPLQKNHICMPSLFISVRLLRVSSSGWYSCLWGILKNIFLYINWLRQYAGLMHCNIIITRLVHIIVDRSIFRSEWICRISKFSRSTYSCSIIFFTFDDVMRKKKQFWN